MRVALLGAAPQVAGRLRRDLLDTPDVSEVLPAQPGSPLECDLVVQAGRVSSHEEVEAASAALALKVPYVSACPDPDAFQALAALNAESEAAGVPLLAGAGWTPGLTALMARAAAARLSKAREVRVAWVVSSLGDGGHEALAFSMGAISGHVAAFERGQWLRRSAGSGEEEVFFPDPVGWKEVRLAAGVEALSLPRLLEGVERVTVKCGVVEPAANRLSRAFSTFALKSSPKSRERLAARARPVLTAFGGLTQSRGGWCAARVDVWGEDGESPASFTFGVVDQFLNLATVPITVAISMLIRGEVKGPGFLTLESAVDPHVFFRYVSERGLRVATLER